MINKFSIAISTPTNERPVSTLWSHFESLLSQPNWAWLKDAFFRLDNCFERLNVQISSLLERGMTTNRLRSHSEGILNLADDIRTACLVFNDYIQPLSEKLEDGEDDPAVFSRLERKLHRKLLEKRKWFTAEQKKLDELAKEE